MRSNERAAALVPSLHALPLPRESGRDPAAAPDRREAPRARSESRAAVRRDFVRSAQRGQRRGAGPAGPAVAPFASLGAAQCGGGRR
jgi:hypothetical protein